jgi:hypothetical protein
VHDRRAHADSSVVLADSDESAGRLGVAWQDDELAGHCWLGLHDAPPAEPRDPRQAFATMVSFPHIRAMAPVLKARRFP